MSSLPHVFSRLRRALLRRVPSSVAPRAFVAWGAALLVAGGLAACASSGSSYSVNEGQIAERFLPAERVVDYHPDSVRALQIVEKDDRIAFELDGSYQSLVTQWSSTFRNVTGARDPEALSYATFWSLELSLAALQSEMGVTGLTKDKAAEIIERRKTKYTQTVQIDVYWFGENGSLVVAGPGNIVELRDLDGNSYRPIRTDYTPIRTAYVRGGRSALYRRNTFWFARQPDDETDLLRDASGLRLVINDSGSSGQYRFQWSWDDPKSTAQR